MREIKFRAWDRQGKEMFVGEDVGGFGVWQLNSDNVYDWMQYTGLKDKNGTEIYEGDIVEYRTDNTEGSPKKPKVVQWVARKYYAGWNIGRSHLGYKVIGNIYQNKDLLKHA